MTVTFDISDELHARVAAIARRSNLSTSQVITDALQNGYSLEWQERFLDQVAAGIDAADEGDFVDANELGRVVGKYRPA